MPRRVRTAARIAAAAAAALLVNMLSGCALSALSAENVMEPPQAFGDGAAIQAVLEEALGPQITLRYPRSGEYRSAVVRADLDNDDHEEAIVFYREATENAGAHMALLDTDEEGRWFLSGEFSGGIGEIDRVMFGDINGDGMQDIITGWSAHSDYGTLRVHSCAGGHLRSLSIVSDEDNPGSGALYSEMSVGDFDRDSVDEVMMVVLNGSSASGEARLLKWMSPMLPGGTGKIVPVATASLRSGAAAYTGCAAGLLSRGIYGIVVDSQRTDGLYSSEVLLWNSTLGTLVSPIDPHKPDLFSRTSNIASQDIDGDGYIDIPGDSLLPDCELPGSHKVYLTDWYRYTADGCVLNFSAVIRTDYGYYFIMPEEWQGLVTVQPDIASRELRFCLAGSRPLFTEELMSIKVFTIEEWDRESSGWNEEPSGYIELCVTDYYVYAIRLPDSPSNLTMDLETISNYFVIIE